MTFCSARYCLALHRGRRLEKISACGGKNILFSLCSLLRSRTKPELPFNSPPPALLAFESSSASLVSKRLFRGRRFCPKARASHHPGETVGGAGERSRRGRRPLAASFPNFPPTPLVCFARIEAFHFPGIEVTTPGLLWRERGGKTRTRTRIWTSKSEIQTLVTVVHIWVSINNFGIE